MVPQTSHNKTFSSFGLARGLLLLMLLACSARAADAGPFKAFGPETFVRGTGAPVASLTSFTVLDPSIPYGVAIQSEGISSAVISLNGVEIFGPSSFNENVTHLQKTLSLHATNSLSVELRSGPGGRLTITITGVDNDPPVIVATPSPQANANGWNKSNVTVAFNCTDFRSGIAACPGPVTVSAEGAGQVVSGTATDKAGNSATATVTVNIDQTAPVFGFVTPPDNATLFAPSIIAKAAVTDSISGVSGVTCNGAAASVNGLNVDCNVPLTPGSNVITGIATDIAGNSTTAELKVRNVKAPKVTITEPVNLSYVNISPTTVSGTVDDASATITINSIPTPVNGGIFTLALPLAEGPNVVTATATTPETVGTASVEITLDTTPPHVTIVSPADGLVTTDDSISVSGSVNDLVVGTVNSEQAQVKVNGAPAAVANRTFLATNVPLAVGPNVIQAIGTDRVGNAATNQIVVTRQPAQAESKIRVISGNNQTGSIGTLLGAPLVVALVNALGQPVANEQVIFKVTQNNGSVAGTGAPGPTAVLATDAQGRAQAHWTLGTRAGAGANGIEAYAVGFAGTAVFTASGTLGTPAKIVVDTGNDQIGPVGEALPKAFIAVVVDGGNNRVADVPVTFTVKAGGGSIQGQPAYSVVSDSDGRVAALLKLGLQEGNANNVVEASFAGNTGFAANFTASGRSPGDPFDTTITGVVLDNSNRPIPGVTMRAVLTTTLNANANALQSVPAVQTDAQGQFVIPQAPVGLVKLRADGSTAELPGEFPSLEYDLITVAGQVNTVSQPIYLLPLNTANQLCVTQTTGGGTLTIPEAPGFSLTFGPGQVTFPGNSKTGCVSVTVVHGDKVPMLPGFGQQPRFIVTIQPAGAIFNPPAPITLPNVDGLAPRAVTEMYSYDHDIGSFVAIGTGVVSDDGLVIRSSTGVGVLKAGWHCGGDPNAIGFVADCPVCQSCQASGGSAACQADPAQNGQQLPNDKCKICKDGSPQSIDLQKLGEEANFSFGLPSETVDKINKSLGELKLIGVDAKVNLLTINGKISAKECCDSANGKGPGKEVSGSVSGDFGGIAIKGKLWPPGPIPFFELSISTGLASLEVKGQFNGGVFLNVSAKVIAEIGYRRKECSSNPKDAAGCVFGKLEINLTPGLSAEIGGSGSITYDCIFCDKTTIAVAASFAAGDFSLPISIAGIQYNAETCSDGLTGGFFKFGSGKYKIFLKFSGSVKTSAGTEKVEYTLTFLDCTINSSGVSCSLPW